MDRIHLALAVAHAEHAAPHLAVGSLSLSVDLATPVLVGLVLVPAVSAMALRVDGMELVH